MNIKKRKNHLEAELQLTSEKLRRVNDIVINGYTKFPEGHKHNIKRMYRNTVFNQDNLKKLYADFEKFRFIKQIKYPEILFAKDSTKIYVYLEKSKANSFDGFIGFSNYEKKKIIFNGYVDLTLNNILNTGETFTLYWKSDGNEQKTFNAAIELPYIFKSPFGLKAQLNIFKQDSTFRIRKPQLIWVISSIITHGFIWVIRQQNQAISRISIQPASAILKNSFVTTNFEFVDFRQDDFLFPKRRGRI